jgi:hypothetical protein
MADIQTVPMLSKNRARSMCKGEKTNDELRWSDANGNGYMVWTSSSSVGTIHLSDAFRWEICVSDLGFITLAAFEKEGA